MMGLGFSFGPAPIRSSPQEASNAMLNQATKPQSVAKDFELSARMAAITAQLGSSSFFGQLNTNRHFTSRMALFSSIARDDDTFEKKVKRGVIRKLKTEKSEASNNGPR
jgi:hypothetical protein